jgi:hypothetical protein
MQLPVPLAIVTVLPKAKHAPVAVMVATVLAFVVAVTVNVAPYGAVAGAPVKPVMGVALFTCRVALAVLAAKAPCAAKLADRL